MAVKSKGKGMGGGGGGFGKVSSNKKEEVKKDVDYKLFPKLEEQVRQSILPMIPENRNDMNDEIYDRLHQIYGTFLNYHCILLLFIFTECQHFHT